MVETLVSSKLQKPSTNDVIHFFKGTNLYCKNLYVLRCFSFQAWNLASSKKFSWDSEFEVLGSELAPLLRYGTSVLAEAKYETETAGIQSQHVAASRCSSDSVWIVFVFVIPACSALAMSALVEIRAWLYMWHVHASLGEVARSL